MSERLSPNFLRSEFACPCCGLDAIDPNTVEYCQEVRDFLDRPVIVTSACRCPSHNEAVGGSPRSQHMLDSRTGLCHAADIVVQGVPAHVVYDLLDEWDVPGLGSYEGWTHLDTREGYARW